LRVCNEPGCTNWTEAPKCPECVAAKRHRSDARRPSAARRGYGATWRVIRARYLYAHPVCEDPSGCVSPSVDVDHIDGRGPSGDNSDGNLQALCHPHHSEKTALRDGGFGRRPALRRDSAV
jgi:5-methylcytosine-specific restriction protein A